MNGQPEGMPWSQWSFVFRSYVGAFDPTATTSMTKVERLSIQLFAEERRCRWSDESPKGSGSRRGNNCAEIAPFSVTIPRNAPSHLGANESGRPGADNLSMGEEGEGLRGTVR